MAAAAAQQEGSSGPQVFMLAENSSFWPEVARAKQLLDEGAIGELVTARAHYYEALNASPFADEAEWLGWRKDLAICGGGIVMDGGQHWLRPMRCATSRRSLLSVVLPVLRSVSWRDSDLEQSC